jgi:glucokinase
MNKYFIGIDLGGTRVKIGLVADEKIIAKVIVPAQSVNGLAASLPFITKHINQLVKGKDLSLSDLGGVALGFPGLVDPFEKKILSTNAKYDDALAINLEDWVKKQWGVPFFLDNDARMAAVGEWKFGAGRDTDNLVVITLGTGIGTSAIIEGKLLRGKHFQAGCLGGHFSVQYNGRQCNCGNIGCVEAYAATWSIKERIMEESSYMQSSLSSAAVIDFETLLLAADSGDALAIHIQQDCLDIWAAGIVNLIHAYDPEVVVIGGGVMNKREKILPYLTEQIHKHAWCPWGKVALRATELLSDAGILGAVYCLQHQV